MKQELDEQLCKDFPKLFRDRNASMQQTCMCWGFPGDGWASLIRECAAKLEAINDKITDPERYIVASQVKEKFGTLRFYVNHYPSEYDKEVSNAIREAERKSEITCEECGEPGEITGKGWLSTRCMKHTKE